MEPDFRLSREARALKRDAQAQYDEGKAFRDQNLVPMWEESHRAHEGDHWHGVNMPKWKAKVVINECERIIRYVLTHLTDARPKFSVFGRGSEDNDKARLVQKLHEYQHERLHMSVRYAMMYLNVLLDGIGYLKVMIDPDARGGMGDLDIVNVSPFHLIMDPSTFWEGDPTEMMRNAEFVCQEHLVPVRRVARRYGIPASQITGNAVATLSDHPSWQQYRLATSEGQRVENLPANADAGSNLIYTNARSVEPYTPDRMLVKEHYMRNDDYPGGIVCMTMAGDTVLKIRPNPEEPYPFEHGKLPFVAFVGNPTPGKFVADSVLKHVYPINKLMNKRWSQLMDHHRQFHSQAVFAEEGVLSNQGVSWAPGAINWVAPGKLDGLKIPPPQQASPDWYRTIEMREKAIERISGIREELTGKMKAGVSGVAYDEVIESALAVIRFLERINSAGYNETARLSQATMQQLYRGTPYVARVVGDDGNPQLLEFQPGSIEGWFDIEVAPQAAYALKQEVWFKQMADLNAMITPDMPVPPEVLIDLTDVPNKEEIKQRVNERLGLIEQMQQMQQMIEQLQSQGGGMEMQPPM